MTDESTLTEASRRYTAAYAAHYSARDLPLAFQLYQKLMASYPGAQEADYCRMQVHNIVNAVVPKQELLDAEIEPVFAHLDHDEPFDAGRSPVAPVAAGLPA